MVSAACPLPLVVPEPMTNVPVTRRLSLHSAKISPEFTPGTDSVVVPIFAPGPPRSVKDRPELSDTTFGATAVQVPSHFTFPGSLNVSRPYPSSAPLALAVICTGGVTPDSGPDTG